MSWYLTPLSIVTPGSAKPRGVGKPVILYDSDSKGSINYLNLAKEVLQKNNMTKMTNEERILE